MHTIFSNLAWWTGCLFESAVCLGLPFFKEGFLFVSLHILPLHLYTTIKHLRGLFRTSSFRLAFIWGPAFNRDRLFPRVPSPIPKPHSPIFLTAFFPLRSLLSGCQIHNAQYFFSKEKSTSIFSHHKIV